MDGPGQEIIVVGVDGSEPSKAALRWALRQASLTQSGLRAVIAWEFPAFYSWDGGPMPPGEFEEAARKSLNDTVDEISGSEPEHETPPPWITREVLHGHSAQVLTETSREASLLVVGSRGHGSFYGALLGSVSQRCAVHASCPVLIVHT